MSWKLLRWTWRMDSPMYVGTSPAGVLNRCRLYIPARPMWGALAAELVRSEAEAVSDDYVRIGNEIRNNVRFSYLFPAEQVGKVWRAWLPVYCKEHGLVWIREDKGNHKHELPDRRFRRRLLWTRPGTAIDPGSDSALEGSLRETECVQTRWRNDEGSPGGPVAMVGYVWIKQDTDLLDRVSTITTLFVGGDTRYGLGRLDRVSSMVPDTRAFNANVKLDHDHPRVATDRLLAHTHLDSAVTISGNQEAVGGWDMTGQQSERRIRGPIWVPGSKVLDPVWWSVDETGLWKFEGHISR